MNGGSDPTSANDRRRAVEALLFRQMISTVWKMRLLLLFGPLVMTVSIARAGRPLAAVVWWLASVGATTAGLAVAVAALSHAEVPPRLRRGFAGAGFLTGAVWGFAPFLVDVAGPADSIARIVPPIGVIAVASAVFAANLPTYLAVATGLTVLNGASLFAIGNPVLREALPSYLMVVLMFTLQAKWLNGQTRTTIAARLHADELSYGLRVERAAALDANARLRVVNQRVRELAERDHLTGAYNRRFLMEQLERLAPHDRDRYVFVLLDLDHFKAANDRFGHATGDQILRHLVSCALHHLTDARALARWGGEEFAFLLEASVLDAVGTIERIRGTLHARVSSPVSPTFSAGVARWSAGMPVEELVRRADKALYQAKDNGRDRVEVYDRAADVAPDAIV